MKKKFSKILGVGLTLALLCSLLLTAAPVSALSVPSVTVSPTTISAADAEYNIRFELDEQLTGGTTVTSGAGAYDLAEIGDSFVITAAAATDVATITTDAGSVDVAMSGTGTWTIGTGVIAFAAIGETATVTVLTVNADGFCDGQWAQTTGSPTAAAGVGADADTITIVFPSDTAVVVDPDAAILAGPGWINGHWADSTTTTLTSVVGTVDTRTVVITLNALDRIGEGAEVRLSFTAGLTNPSSSGSYNLTVATSKEAAETSSTYEMTVPDIGVLPGIVQQYNAADPMVLMAQDTGDDAIYNMVLSAGDNFTVVVGPGKYAPTGDGKLIDITQAGLTLKSSAGAEDTTIDATGRTGYAITVSGAGATVDGFTIKPASAGAITVTGADAIVQDNIITSTAGYPEGIRLGGTGATVSGNELSLYTTMMVMGATGATLSDNTFGAGINLAGSTDITITDNDLTGAQWIGIRFDSTGSNNVLIEGNTISAVTASTNPKDAGIGFFDGITLDKLQIIGNDITDNLVPGIVIPADVTLDNSVIKFNTIIGNKDYGIKNDNTSVAVDATFNWWGPDGASVGGTGTVTTAPVLADTAEAVFSASDAKANATSLDASTTVGVKVEGATDATTIAVAKYIANPQEAIAGAIAFYDVYVATTSTDKPTIKFYAGDALTKVYIWSAGTQIWSLETSSFSAYGGYVWVTVDPAMLGGTPFALVAGAAEPMTAPTIAAPDIGEKDVSITPTFVWSEIPGADAYHFELADNANFVVSLVKLDGELGGLIVTAYAYAGELDYSTAYYWRVKAVSGSFNPAIPWVSEAHFDEESPWTTGVFTTLDEPEEEPAQVWMCSEGLTFDTREALEEHLATHPAHQPEEPPELVTTEITPAWIYVIIGVGAVLVIALLVLIVRTRRVA